MFCVCIFTEMNLCWLAIQHRILLFVFLCSEKRLMLFFKLRAHSAFNAFVIAFFLVRNASPSFFVFFSLAVHISVFVGCMRCFRRNIQKHQFFFSKCTSNACVRWFEKERERERKTSIRIVTKHSRHKKIIVHSPVSSIDAMYLERVSKTRFFKMHVEWTSAEWVDDWHSAFVVPSTRPLKWQWTMRMQLSNSRRYRKNTFNILTV